MLDKPQIVQPDRQPTAVIRLTIPRLEIRKGMAPGRRESMAVVAGRWHHPAWAMVSRAAYDGSC